MKPFYWLIEPFTSETIILDHLYTLWFHSVPKLNEAILLVKSDAIPKVRAIEWSRLYSERNGTVKYERELAFLTCDFEGRLVINQSGIL